MNITLRQAHKLIDKINARLGTFQISATKAVNIWEVEDPASTFTQLTAQFTELCKRNRALVTARQTIRNLIQQANVGAIDNTIAQRKAELDNEGFLRHLVNTVNRHAINTPTALARKLEADRAAASASSVASYRGDTDSIAVCLYSDADVEQIDAQLSASRLAIEKLEDKLSQLNSSTSITLSAETTSALQAEGLV
jgi:hypothetical protein